MRIRVDLILFLLLAALSGCTSKKTLVNKLKFSSENIVVPGVDFPAKFGGYNYTWFSFDQDSLLKLHYVIDDTLLQSFSLDGKFNDFFPLPKSAHNYGFNTQNVGKKLFYFSFPGNLYEYSDGSFKLILSREHMTRLKKDGLDINLNFDFGNYSRIYKDSFLIVPLTAGLEPNLKYSDLFSKYPLFAKVHIPSGRVEYLHYFTPVHYLRYDHYLNHTARFTLAGDELLIHYPYKEVVERYSLSQNKVIGECEFRSYYQEEEIKSLSTGDQADHKKKARYQIEAGHYASLVYNPYKKHYYRVFYHPLDELTGNGEYTIASDKRCSVAVFDSQFRFLGEYLLPRHFSFIMGVTPIPQGFIINSSAKRSKKGLKLMRINY